MSRSPASTAPSDPPSEPSPSRVEPRRHVLTDAGLAALGAGRPSTDTIAELRKAQLGRHLLLLREIVRATPQARISYEHLTVTQRTHPERVQAVLADPLTGAWAAQCLTALRAGRSPGPAGVGHLATLAAIAGSGAAPDDRMLRAECAGLEIAVRLVDANPLRGLLGLTPTGRLTDTEVSHWQTSLRDAWRLLVTRHRADAERLAAVLAVIVPVQADPAAGGISATSAHAFGAVAMSAPGDGAALAVGLLHETQHSVLNAVHHLFDLHTEPDTLGYSPWRDDPRPASGVLHGAYAYLAVTRFWRAQAAADPADRLAAFEFARWRAAVAASAAGLLAGGTLAPAGVRLVTALHEEVRPWLDEPVDPQVARLAAGANTDHRLRWRLRNRTVDEGTAARLASAWRADRPAPEPASRLIPAPRRALENSTRLTLTHRFLAGRGEAAESAGDLPAGCGEAAESAEGSAAGRAAAAARAVGSPAGGGALSGVGARGRRAGGRVTAGDAAYLRGDYGTALRAYREEVVEKPGDRAAWAGLALVSGDLPAIEVVAATYLALADDAPDPIRLARWIARGSGDRPPTSLM